MYTERMLKDENLAEPEFNLGARLRHCWYLVGIINALSKANKQTRYWSLVFLLK